MIQSRHHEPCSLDVFDRHESEVRSYVRGFPTVFRRAQGSLMYDERDAAYIDLFAGAGALNYGHNNPCLKEKLVDYIASDGITHSLDMATSAKRAFIEEFERVILGPRSMTYRLMFPGPTGTNAVESALKIARKATGRRRVFGFKAGFHGMTLGALSITANRSKRDGAGVPMPHADLMPFDGDTVDGVDSLSYLRAELERSAEAQRLPAAMVLETVQCEGGVRVASPAWLRAVQGLCREHGVHLVIDDIQAGCGRTGRFFSFEEAGLDPDLVCLSKSLSGMGLPFALVLVRPELDVLAPGEHNGTFRGHNLAFVTARAALGYWHEDQDFEATLARRAQLLQRGLEAMLARPGSPPGEVRGRGLVKGIAFHRDGVAAAVARRCFAKGVVIETAGHRDEVLKFLPALTIDDATLERALGIVADALGEVAAKDQARMVLA